MEDPDDYQEDQSEDELCMGLTDALARDAPHIVLTSSVMSRAELDCLVHSFTFERDQTRAMMFIALAGRDAAYAEKDAALTAQDAAIADRDAHQAYAEEVVGQARQFLDHQDGTIHTATTLLRRIEAMDQELRAVTQIVETISYLALLARLTFDL